MARLKVVRAQKSQIAEIRPRVDRSISS